MVQVRLIYDEFSRVSSVAFPLCSHVSNCLWVCKSTEIWKLKKTLVLSGRMAIFLNSSPAQPQQSCTSAAMRGGRLGWACEVQEMLPAVALPSAEQRPLCARFLWKGEQGGLKCFSDLGVEPGSVAARQRCQKDYRGNWITPLKHLPRRLWSPCEHSGSDTVNICHKRSIGGICST